MEKIPEYRNGLIYLAVALGESGKYEQAAQVYIRALQRRMEPVFFEEKVLVLFRKWVGSRPSEPESMYFYGVFLHQFGHFREALDVQREVLEGLPYEDAVLYEIDQLQKAVSAAGETGGTMEPGRRIP